MIDLAQLENEINEFHSNIVASQELLDALHAATLAMQETAAANAQLAHANKDAIAAATGKIGEAQDTIRRCVNEVNAAAQKISEDGKVQTALLRKSFESVTGELTEANKTVVSDAMVKLQGVQDNYMSELDRVSELFEEHTAKLSKQYLMFLKKIEDAQIDHLFDEVESMKRNLNKKLSFALGGALAAAVISFIGLFI